MTGMRRGQDMHMIMVEEGKEVGWTTNMYCTHQKKYSYFNHAVVVSVAAE